MSLYCPDCCYPHRLTPDRDEDTGELIGFECEHCHGLFEDPEEDDGGET